MKALVPWIPILCGGLALCGVLLGIVATVATEVIRNKAAHTREREARKEARHDAIVQKRNEFQRTTLLELQEQSQKLMRDAFAHHVFDKESTRKHGRRFAEPYPDAMEAEGMEVNGRTAILVTRVADDEVRRLVQALKDEMNKGFPDGDMSERDAWMNQATFTTVALNTRIGEVLRMLDLDMDAQS